MTTATETQWPRYHDAMVIDACGGPGRENRGPVHPPLDAGELADIRNSGVTALNFTVGSVGSYTNDYEETIQNIAYWDAQIAAHPDVMMKVILGAQLDEAKRSRRLGIIYGFQDTTMYGENLDRFDVFHDFGVRIVQLTYNRRNLMGDGCLETGNAGLSTLGRDMVAKMNERGVLVDLSHCGQRTTHEGIEASKKPVAITHAGCRAVADMPRNKRDEELRLLADRGGVIGIYIMPYLRNEGQVMAEDVIKHIEYAVKICGEEHVGIGTDGTISAVDVTPEFKKQFRRRDRRAPEARHLRAGRACGFIYFRPGPQYSAAFRAHRVVAVAAWAFGCAHRENPRRQFRAALSGSDRADGLINSAFDAAVNGFLRGAVLD